jgi:hypothetical protein
MIGVMMSQPTPLEFILPSEFNQAHHDALITYLRDDRSLQTAVWRLLYQGINLLKDAHVVTEDGTRTFRQVYDELIGRPFANQYIEQLLETENVTVESPKLAAHFARQIRPILQDAGVLKRDKPYSVLLQGYCLYWW